MARVPNDELERLKSVDLVRLVESDGLVLKRIGKDLACACPFHEGDREELDTLFFTNARPCAGRRRCGARQS
jgi:hypothetical protein